MKYDDAVKFIQKTARSLDPDPAHGERVAKNALAIFDGLKKIHGCGKKQRRLLEAASFLHDIGWSGVGPGSAGHHRLSARMIRGLDIPGFSKDEVGFISMIARYHTKAEPDVRRHRRFAALGKKERALVEWLAGMLRVADGLDARHIGNVKVTGCRKEGGGVCIELKTSGGCDPELMKAAEKQTLLSKKLKMRIVYSCS